MQQGQCTLSDWRFLPSNSKSDRIWIKTGEAIKKRRYALGPRAYYTQGSCFSVNYQLFCEVNMHISTEMTGLSAIWHRHLLGLNVPRETIQVESLHEKCAGLNKTKCLAKRLLLEGAQRDYVHVLRKAVNCRCYCASRPVSDSCFPEVSILYQLQHSIFIICIHKQRKCSKLP